MTEPGSGPIAGVPVKSFAEAKRRLSPHLSDSSRRRLVVAIAEHVLGELTGAGIRPLVVAGSAEVAGWASDIGVDSIPDPGGGLSRAAAAAVDRARSSGRSWLVVPADLPLLRSSDLLPAVTALAERRPVIAPARDGGTNLFGWDSYDVAFSYGPASFHRHLAQVARFNPVILTGPGLQLDLDSPPDLQASLRHPRGRWLSSEPAIRSAS